MYCSKCGLAVSDSQEFCAGCGHLVGKQGQAAEAVQQQHFDRTIRRLSRFWYLFAGLNMALGAMGIAMMNAGATSLSGPWEPWPHPPGWNWTLAAGVAWTLLISRVVVSTLAGWGLQAHTEWGRPVSFLAGAVAVLEFPIGVVLGIYSCAVLLGKQHAALYNHWAHAK